jgi:hypothetical protein
VLTAKLGRQHVLGLASKYVDTTAVLQHSAEGARMQTGYVALLDVLGFSSLVLGDSAGDGLSRYLSALQRALSSSPAGKRIDSVIFSDSIVLSTEDGSLESLQSLLLRSSNLFQLLLESDIPIRGSIAYGSFERSHDVGGNPANGVFVAGRAIIDAYNFEMQQDWVGIMLTPSVIARVPQLRTLCDIGQVNDADKARLRAIEERIDWASPLQPCGQIPFHSQNPLVEPTYAGFAVVPTGEVRTPHRVAESLSQALVRLEWLKSIAPTPPAQQKYDRTVRWLHEVRNRWFQIDYWIKRFIEEKSY